MKRFLALLLLLTLLPVIPVMAEEKIDIPAVIQEDTWVDDNFTMTFAADGTGVLNYNGTEHAGTWEVVNELVYFHYEQYGDQTIKLAVSKFDGDYRLSSNYFQLQEKAVRERIQKESTEAAEKKTTTLAFGDEVTLDFMKFSLTDVKVYRSLYQLIDDYPWTYPITKGKQFVVIYGTVTNADQNSRWLNSMRGTLLLDDGTSYPTETYVIRKGDTYYNSTLDAGATGRLCISAEIPEDVVGSFKSAQLSFSLYNYLAGNPQKDFEGDFFFRMDIDEAKVKAARKGPARKKTTFAYGKNKSVPKPSSYNDVVEETGGSYQTMHPTTGKGVDIKNFYFHSKFDGETPQEIVSAYVKGLKADGFTVKKVDGSKSKYNNESMTFYTIAEGKTVLGWIQTNESNTYSAEIYIVKK